MAVGTGKEVSVDNGALTKPPIIRWVFTNQLCNRSGFGDANGRGVQKEASRNKAVNVYDSKIWLFNQTIINPK